MNRRSPAIGIRAAHTDAGGTVKARILMLGPDLDAVSGVSTHLNQLRASELHDDYDLMHFQIGSEGRRESRFRKAFRLLVSPLMLAARIVKDRVDIVHINASIDHRSFPRDATYLAVARALHRKVVFQVHGGEMPRALYANSAVGTQLVARVLRSADAVVLLSKAELEAYTNFVPDARLQIIANAVDTDAHANSESWVRPVFGPLRLAYVGRLVATKGVADCVAAANLLNEAGRDFTLKIAGSGPEEQALRNRAESLVKAGKVEFVGALHGEAKAKLWHESHIFVFPTFHLEGLPYSLLEAMAAGTVPITTRMGAQPDVLEDGVQGVFVAPEDPQALVDAITVLDDDRELLLAMSQMAKQRIDDRYTVGRLSNEFRNVYRSLEAK